jgi:phospholipid/cholesterol/gamma-HCH transport system substrate-binding protein
VRAAARWTRGRRTSVEREARYALVAGFALLAIAAAAAFVWWYSGRSDRRTYETYEIYFEGSVSGLSQGSPVRYLGVDVGRVRNMKVDHKDPGRVKVIAEVDSEAPVSSATRARLGLLGLTGLLYIDLQVDPEADASQSLARGERHRVIPARKGSIEAFLERLPDLVAHASDVMSRIETLLGEENVNSVGDTLRNLREATATLPALSRDAAALAAELRTTVQGTTALARRLDGMAADSQPELLATLESSRAAAEKLARTSASLERIVASNETALAGAAGTGAIELQQLLIDLRDTSAEVNALARTLRERPSSLLRDAPERGVELPP